MKRFFVIISILFLFLGMERVSRSEPMYRPDTLTFSKMYYMPGYTKNELYCFANHWFDLYSNLSVHSGDPKHHWSDTCGASCWFEDLYLAGKPAKLLINIYLNYYYGCFEFKLTEISVVWGAAEHLETCLSTHDDRTNRTWFWLLVTNRKVLDAARVEAERLFNEYVASMDEYVKLCPPPESKQNKK